MINNLCILFSLAIVVYVAIRASVLDAKRPWFQKTTPVETVPDTAPGGARHPMRARR
jgi:hypothetical protein